MKSSAGLTPIADSPKIPDVFAGAVVEHDWQGPIHPEEEGRSQATDDSVSSPAMAVAGAPPYREHGGRG
jgi:hypothetical protein